MDYDIVELKEKTVAGLAARTNNLSPDMGAVIGGLWKRFYGEGIYGQLKHKVNGKAMGIYSDYGRMRGRRCRRAARRRDVDDDPGRQICPIRCLWRYAGGCGKILAGTLGDGS